MKFNIQKLSNGLGRCGLITELGRHGDKTLATPACMMYTRGGSSPHISGEVLDFVKNTPGLLQISLNHFIEHQETLEDFNKGIAEFTSMTKGSIFCSLHDPAVEVATGYNDKNGVALWSRCGKTMVDVDLFMRSMEAMMPDWYQALSDGDTDLSSSRKRVLKSVDRTLTFLDKIVEKHESSERLQKSAIFGSIEGGYDIKERKRSAKETAARPVQGFVIEGFHRFGASANLTKMDKMVSLLKETNKILPEDKPRLMQSVWKPDAVLHAVQLGVDIFDSSYPYLVTEKGAALVFDFQYEEPVNTPSENEEDRQFSCFEIDLTDKIYSDDFTPILANCRCYSCLNFTRAYIHHLLNTSEILASVLLMLHNFSHYFHYFVTIRQAMLHDKLPLLQKCIDQQRPVDKQDEEKNNEGCS